MGVIGGDVIRLVRMAVILAGALLFAYLVYTIGPGVIAASFVALSWRLLIVLVFPFSLVAACDTLGWYFAFRRDHVSFWTLFTTRLAGEAVNGTTPTGSVGGEAVEAWLIHDRVPIRESLPSIIVAKTTITVAQGLFLLFGIGCAWWAVATDEPLIEAMALAFGFEALAVGGFTSSAGC